MKRLTLTLAITALTVSFSGFADDSVEHSGQASKHSVLASSEGLASTAAVASAVAVTPVILSAGASMAAHGASHQVHQSLEHNPKPKKLVITEKVITVDAAPDAQLRQTVTTVEQ